VPLRPYPLIDRAGRFAPFKAAVFVLLFVPGLWTAYDFAAGNLGPRPLDEATHQIGTWTLRFIFLSLAVTPLRDLLQWPKLLAVRRMIGVAAFVYAVAHLGFYFVHQAFDVVKVASEIVLRIYLTIGFLALLGLTALAATSTDAMIRRLGAKRWRRLHQAVYVIGLLAVIHFFMQSKLNVYEPTIMAGLYVWLMLYRMVVAFSPAARKAPLLLATGLAVVSAGLTVLGEAVYFKLMMNVPMARVLAANLVFDVDIDPRPGWIVLAISLAVVVVAALRRVVLRRRLQLQTA
jgi:methionine sulfoxide reductase heme-binding subunit